MYFPSIFKPGDAHIATRMEYGKQYLLTVTNIVGDATASLEFGHGDDPNWTPIDGATDAVGSIVIPFYCNGALRLRTTGTGTDSIYVSMLPIITRTA